MDEEKALDNDLKKLHAEVNQIVSQRFQLTNLAILVFAAICGWATSSINRQGGIGIEYVSVITVLVILVLGTIFFYFMLLLGMMRIFTVYLEEKFGSHWESDWHEYRQQPSSRQYFGYSKAGASVFLLLGPLAVAFFLMLSWLSGGFVWRPLLWLPFGALLLYLIGVGGAVRARHLLIKESTIKRNWTDAIRSANEKRKKASADDLSRRQG